MGWNLFCDKVVKNTMTNEAAPAYRSLLTNRSRRLRIIGSLLLLASLGMAIYGGIVLMPSLRAAKAATLAQTLNSRTPEAIRAKKIMKTKLIFAYGYWSVCGVLVTAILLTAWLDVREMSRSYVEQRKSLWANVADKEKTDADA